MSGGGSAKSSPSAMPKVRPTIWGSEPASGGLCGARVSRWSAESNVAQMGPAPVPPAAQSTRQS